MSLQLAPNVSEMDEFFVDIHELYKFSIVLFLEQSTHEIRCLLQLLSKKVFFKSFLNFYPWMFQQSTLFMLVKFQYNS